MTKQKLIVRVEQMLKDKTWGSHRETEDVLQEMLAFLNDEASQDYDDGDVTPYAAQIFDDCLDSLRANAYTDVSNPFET